MKDVQHLSQAQFETYLSQVRQPQFETSRKPAGLDFGPGAEPMSLNFASPSTAEWQNNANVRCDAGKESERWCLCEPCKDEATAEQGRGMSGETAVCVLSRAAEMLGLEHKVHRASPTQGQDRLEQNQGIAWHRSRLRLTFRVGDEQGKRRVRVTEVPRQDQGGPWKGRARAKSG